MIKKINTTLLVFLSVGLTAMYFYMKTRTPSDAITHGLSFSQWLQNAFGIWANYELILFLLTMFFLFLATTFSGALLSRYLKFSHKIPDILCLLPQVWVMIIVMMIVLDWMPKNGGITSYLILVSYHDLLPYSYLILLFSSTLFFLRKKSLAG
jgi:hypothetical protein